MTVFKASLTLCLVLLCLTVTNNSWADEIILTHRSGKVQVIPVEAHDDPVEQVSFRRTSSAGTPDKQPGQPATTVTTPAEETRPMLKKTTPPAGDGSKQPFKLKWAPPMDTQ